MTDGNPTFGNPAITASKMTAVLPARSRSSRTPFSRRSPRPDRRRVVRLPVRRVRGRLRVRSGAERLVTAVTGDRLAGVSDHGRHQRHHRLGGGRVQAPQRDPVAVRNRHVDGEQDHVQHHQADVDRLAGVVGWTDFNDAVGSPLLGCRSRSRPRWSPRHHRLEPDRPGRLLPVHRVRPDRPVVEFMPIVTNSAACRRARGAAHKRVGGDAPNPTPSASAPLGLRIRGSRLPGRLEASLHLPRRGASPCPGEAPSPAAEVSGRNVMGIAESRRGRSTVQGSIS